MPAPGLREAFVDQTFAQVRPVEPDEAEFAAVHIPIPDAGADEPHLMRFGDKLDDPRLGGQRQVLFSSAARMRRKLRRIDVEDPDALSLVRDDRVAVDNPSQRRRSPRGVGAEKARARLLDESGPARG